MIIKKKSYLFKTKWKKINPNLVNEYFKNGKHLYHTTPLYEKEFKEMPDNPGKEILQVEGVMESCDKDLQEILKRDTEIEQDRLKGCLDLIKKDHPNVDIENFYVICVVCWSKKFSNLLKHQTIRDWVKTVSGILSLVQIVFYSLAPNRKKN